jgi:hypothetical protein
MGNRVTDNLRSKGGACIPEDTRMSQQKVTSGRAIHLKFRRNREGVSHVKQHQRNVVLAQAVCYEAIHSKTENHDLGFRTLPKKALQRIEPIIVPSTFKEDGADVHLVGGQFLQAVDVDALQQKRIAYH